MNAAAEAAEKAEEYGINTANLSQIHGEIEYAKGNYGKAEEYLKECIATTSDDYRKMRAYITCAQAISAGGTVEDLDRSIDFLTKGLTDVSMEYRGYLTGLLSENYIQAYGLTEEDKYCDGAIKYSKELIDTGWASYSTYNNIIILCTNSGIQHRPDGEALSGQLQCLQAQSFPGTGNSAVEGRNGKRFFRI